MSRLVTRTLAAGALLGAVILGVGGRFAMAAIASSAGAKPSFTVGGTLTVVGLGAVSGLAGAIIALVSRWGMCRLMPSRAWPQHVLFAVLLLLVTLRGLHGTAPIGRWLFFPLVAVYGITLGALLSRSSRASAGAAARR
jgi:hypothetical protein